MSASGSRTPKRIFLVGCARSGTTIAQKFISDAVGALTVPETNFFPALYGDFGYRVFGTRGIRHPASVVRAACDVTWPRRRAVQASLDALADAIDVPAPVAGARMSGCVDSFVACMDGVAQAAAAGAWLEKSPSHLYYLDYIEQAVPGALFVHILRDGVDTVASLQDAGRKYAGDGNNFSTDIHANIARWNQAMRWHRRYLGRPRHVHAGFGALAGQDWAVLLGVGAAGPGVPRKSPPISRGHEVWKAGAVTGELQAPESKRGLLSALELRALKSGLLGGGDIARLFPGLPIV